MFWIVVLIVAAIFTYFVLIKPLNYWSDRGVPQYKFWITWIEILVGFTSYRSLPETSGKNYNDFSGKRYCGIYQFCKPTLLLRDPELVKQITVKDFDHFADRSLMLPEDSEPIWSKNLFVLKGSPWRDMRSTLSPSFTGSKMRLIFGLMSECAKQFVEHFQEKDLEVISLEMRDAITKFTNDVIASSAFGVNCNSLKEPENQFYMMGKEIINFRSLWTNLKMMIIFSSPKLTKVLGLKFFKESATNYFKKIIKDNIHTREKNGIIRPDMIHLLMEARKGKKGEKQEEVAEAGFAVVEESLEKGEQLQSKKLSDNDITAQALIFFIAGYNGVSVQMCFMAHELAVNPEVQERLQEEVDETLKKCNGVITYEALMKMRYMDMVVSESLRKWPIGLAIERICIKPYTIAPVEPEEEPVHLKEGVSVWMPIYGFHRDPQYYPEPERFDPERFSDENKSCINPYTYIPFGVGPRHCIANRFALMEIKTIFFYMLAKFDITVVEKTKIPLKVAKSQFELSADGGFWLGLKRRKI